jgi:hypothetical protein
LADHFHREVTTLLGHFGDEAVQAVNSGEAYRYFVLSGDGNGGITTQLKL